MPYLKVLYQPLNTCNSAFCTSISDGGKHFKAFISGANALNFFFVTDSKEK